MQIWDKVITVQKVAVDTQLQYKIVQKDDGTAVIIDRGSRSDIYSGSFTCIAKTAEIYDIMQQIRRDSHIGISNCNPDEALFGENVDYTNSIGCAVLEIGDIRHRSYTTSEITLKVQAEQGDTPLSFVGNSALPQMKCISNGWSIKSRLGQTFYDSYFGNQFVSDSLRDIFQCELSATITLADAISLLNWFRLQRGATFTMNQADWGIAYPFGKGIDNGGLVTESFSYPFTARMLSLTVDRIAPTHRRVTMILEKESQ